MDSLRRGLQQLVGTNNNIIPRANNQSIERTLYLDDEVDDEEEIERRTRSPAIMNWTRALIQIGGDIEFLDEILDDIVEELTQVIEDLERGIQTQEFRLIRNAAHLTYGTAMFFGCERLKISACKIQSLGEVCSRSVSSESDNELRMNDIREEYLIFRNHANDCQREFERWKELHPVARSSV
jgi:HPt (histidine-containing phosphotransfer) domain-containing protein